MSPSKVVIPEGEWRVATVRRWPFGKQRVRWYFETDLPQIDKNEKVTITFPPVPVTVVFHKANK